MANSGRGAPVGRLQRKSAAREAPGPCSCPIGRRQAKKLVRPYQKCEERRAVAAPSAQVHRNESNPGNERNGKSPAPPTTSFPAARGRGGARGGARGARFGFGRKVESVHLAPYRLSFERGNFPTHNIATQTQGRENGKRGPYLTLIPDIRGNRSPREGPPWSRRACSYGGVYNIGQL